MHCRQKQEKPTYYCSARILNGWSHPAGFTSNGELRSVSLIATYCGLEIHSLQWYKFLTLLNPEYGHQVRFDNNLSPSAEAPKSVVIGVLIISATCNTSWATFFKL